MCALLALCLWWYPQWAYSHDYAISLGLAFFTAYVILETNNTYQVIRVRSRMMSAVWLFAVACLTFLHPFQPSLLAAFFLVGSYYLLFRTYQQQQPVVDVFHTFLLLSVGSLFLPPMILFTPFYFWYLIVFMRALTLRSFFSALIGLSLPFWFWGGWLLWKGDFTPLCTWYADLGFSTIGWETLSRLQDFSPLSSDVFTFLVLSSLTLWTSVYYLMNSYDDKIRTRMMMYIYIFQSVLVIIFSVLTADISRYIPLLLVSVSPLMSHYFTLRRTWLGFVVFLLTVICFVIIFVNPAVVSEYLTTFAHI